jgi:molybdenum cofactor synthesis domain-containing protein
MQKGSMISVEQAQAIALECARRLDEEQVDLADCFGRVLSRDVVADMDVAPFDNTAMDGFAVVSSDLSGASEREPVTLRVLAEEGAGSSYSGTVVPGTTVRIMTGAPIPAGADAVVKFEQVEGGESAGQDAVFSAPVKPGANIRRAGEEFRRGDVVLRSCERVNAYAMGMLASAGAVSVSVFRRPRVGVFSIGSELVSPAQTPAAGKIRNSNTACLAGLATDALCEPRVYPIVPDDRDAIASQLRRALDECDAVVTAGGASKGDFDYINGVIAELGEVKFDYISLRPGKRQTLGVVDGKPVWGLSGNPAAAAVGFELLARPVLRAMQGMAPLPRPVVRARLATDVKKKETRRYYERGLVERAQDGSWVATEFRGQSSALLGALQRCNCLIILPDDSLGMKAGDEVDCMRIDIPEGTQA